MAEDVKRVKPCLPPSQHCKGCRLRNGFRLSTFPRPSTAQGPSLDEMNSWSLGCQKPCSAEDVLLDTFLLLFRSSLVGPLSRSLGVSLGSSPCHRDVSLEPCPSPGDVSLGSSPSYRDVSFESCSSPRDVSLGSSICHRDVSLEPCPSPRDVSLGSSPSHRDVSLEPCPSSGDVSLGSSPSHRDVSLEPCPSPRDVSPGSSL